MTCTRCKVPKTRININIDKPGIRAIWADEKGGRWKGRICQSCVTEIRKRNMNKVGAPLPPQMTKRLCRKCSKPLPAEYYYRHKECQLHTAELSDEYSDIIYV